jgi:hypothetical protein
MRPNYKILNLIWAFFLLMLGVAVLVPSFNLFPFGFIVVMLNWIDFGIHEMGHIVLGITGIVFLGILGGSLFQWGGPLLMMAYSFYQKRFTTAFFFLFWFGKSLNESVPYIRDAHSQALPLMSPFFFTGEPIAHDWNYMLGQMHLLGVDQAIAGIFWVVSTLVLLCAIFLTAIPGEILQLWIGHIISKLDRVETMQEGLR